MAGHDIIVIGASAGGVEALARLAQDLPSDMPAALFVVHHFPVDATSVLPNILNRAGPLRALHPKDREPIEPGHIYVAPPNRHTLLLRGSIHLVQGPRENGHRPAIDPIFRSAARVYGRRVIGVILTGTLDDGTAGLQFVKARGGLAVVQDPENALYSGMPLSAIEHVEVDYVVPLEEMGALLARLAAEPAATEADAMGDEDAMTDMATPHTIIEHMPGKASFFTCPECHGALWELQEGDVLRFRCHVGHAFSSESLISKQTEALEAALWSALRALEESAALSRRMGRRAHERNHKRTAARFDAQARDAEAHASVLRKVLMQTKGGLGGDKETGKPNAP
ncbi:MAG TPA: chemotaxis protein CheB [Chthonomonadaceae bacterium]|nr:chemotaxis protein CheB [Chthonomonadaceae bacterium]